MQVSPVLERIFELSGVEFAWFRNGVELDTIVGLRNKDRFTEKQYIAVYPTLDIRRGDMLRAEDSGTEYWIYNFDYEICDGEKFQGMAFHVPLEEWEVIKQQVEEEDIEDNRPGIDDYLNYLQALARIKAPGQNDDFEPLFNTLNAILSQPSAEWGSLCDYTPLLEDNPWLEQAVSEILMQRMK